MRRHQALLIALVAVVLSSCGLVLDTANVTTTTAPVPATSPVPITVPTTLPGAPIALPVGIKLPSRIPTVPTVESFTLRTPDTDLCRELDGVFQDGAAMISAPLGVDASTQVASFAAHLRAVSVAVDGEQAPTTHSLDAVLHAFEQAVPRGAGSAAVRDASKAYADRWWELVGPVLQRAAADCAIEPSTFEDLPKLTEDVVIAAAMQSVPTEPG